MVVQEEGASEGLFDKYPAPPPQEIHNLTAPLSAPGHPIESGVFNASNRAEDIYLVRNQVLEVDYDMKSSPENVPLVDTHAAEKMFEGHTWGWDGIDLPAVVAQN